MNSQLRFNAHTKTFSIYLTAIVLSVLLSCWMAVRTTVINPDAICYLQSADAMGSLGIKQAMQLCGQAKWPFYSLLIYSFSLVTHASSLIAANVLDGLFSLISVVAFIFLVHVLGATQRTLWLAAVVILFAHEFNSVREYIIRDHGFWAFYLVSIIALIQYFRAPSWSYALLWSFSMIMAALFRIEGALFLLGLPLLSGLQPSKRFRQFLQLNAVTLLVATLMIGMLSLHPQPVERIHEIQVQFTHGYDLLVHQFVVTKNALAHNVLSPYSAKDAGLILALLLTVWYIQSVMVNLSFVYVALVFYAWSCKALRLDNASKRVILGYLIINFVITAAFLTENLFLSKRYLIALTLIFMLWVPFALTSLIAERKRHPVALFVVILTMIIYAVGGMVSFNAPKTYLRDAGQWLAENTSPSTKIYSNNEQVMYYSHHFGDSIFQQSRLYADMATVTEGKWKQYDFLALRLLKNELTTNIILKELTMVPVKVFSNKHGDQVVIYQVSR